MSGTTVQEALAALRVAYDALAAAEVDLMDSTEIVAALDELETLTCQLPTQNHRLLARLQDETTPKQMGAKSWRDVLMIRWRLAPGEASRRLAEADDLGPRHALTGPAMPPRLPATAAAQALGLLTGAHVAALRDAMAKVPGYLTTAERAQFEVELVRLAVGIGPKDLKEAARRKIFVLDQDGPLPDDTERQRKRGFVVGKQQPTGNVPFSGEMNPEAWAVWCGKPSSPSSPHPACATPTTPNPASPARPPRRRSTTTTARSPNAATTRYW